jgi:hypothetical protein
MVATFGTGFVERADRELVEDRPALGSFTLHKAGALMPGATSTWRWPNGLTITVRATSNGVTLLTGDRVQRIEITRLRLRHWSMPQFLCPDCRRRCAKLHERGGVWACRFCLGLEHASRHCHRWMKAGFSSMLDAVERRSRSL